MAQALAVDAGHRAGGVTRIALPIGPLAGVEPPMRRAAFPLAAAGSRGEGTRLPIETPALTVECQLCGAVSRVRPKRLLCGACGTWCVALLGGDEMGIDAVDLSEPETANV